MDGRRHVVGCFTSCLLLTGMPGLCKAQTSAGDIAAQVRNQGYRCEQPTTAVRDVKLSKPELAVWVLKCGNATYRIRLDPDMAARITRLKEKPQAKGGH
jgi:hypothetical protein